ncbi:MAG: bifunctional DNA-formamidopyrimidine glycosylase/DNA-(apurinic or apyrimidinic site) lyase [Patescibacteria group bacterium]
MPELPEVETVVRGLRKRLIGEPVLAVEVRNAMSFQADRGLIDRHLVGACILIVERVQKLIIVKLSSGYALVCHLKMTGQMVFVGKSDKGFVGGHPEKAYEQPLPHKHTHVILTFPHGTLYFNDLRKFGWIRLFSREQREAFLAAQQFGPDPLTKLFTGPYLWERIHGRKVPIKSLLLDQHIAPGVGNIYADEALFDAKISPLRKGTAITKQEADALAASVRKVIEMGIQYGGTTKNNYRSVDGSKGEMQHHLKVYGREGQPCHKCPGLVVRKKIGQRSSHYCPSCQH